MTPIKKLCLIITFLIIPGYSFGLNTTITPSAGVTSVYTDNLNLTEDNEENDWITYIQPGLSSNFESRTTQTMLSYSGNYSYYKKNDDNNTLGHTGIFRHVNQLTRYSTLTLSDSYVETESLRVERETDIRDTRKKYTTNNAVMDYGYQFGENNRFGSTLQYDTLENDDETLNDNQSISGIVGFDYERFSSAWLTARHTTYNSVTGIPTSDDYNSLAFSGRLKKDLNKFTNVFVNYDHIYMHYLTGDSEDYHIFDPSVGLTHTWSKTSQVSLGIGWLYEKNDQTSDDSRVYATIDLNKNWDFKNVSYLLTAKNGYEQTNRDSENRGNNFYYETTGSARYTVSRTLLFLAEFGYRYNIYEEPGVSIGDRKDNDLDASSSLRWSLNDYLFASVGYEFHLRDSDDDSYDYKENRVSMTINLIYWKRI